jgi:hypothetical protein
MKKQRYVQPTSETVRLKMESQILQGSPNYTIFWLGDESYKDGVQDYGADSYTW